MEENRIKTIHIEDFNRNDPQIDYLDDDIIMTSSMENLPYQNEVARMNLFAIVMCEAGRAQVDINGKTYQLNANEVLFCLPTMILSNILFSPGYKMSLIGFSTRFLQRFVKKEQDTDSVMYHISRHPIHTSDSKEVDERFHHYEELILDSIKRHSPHYRKEILQYLFSALFHEMLSELYSYAKETQDREIHTNQEAQLFKRFMEEVAKDGGVHRTVNYYATRLCYTPKYLSAAVKQASGRTALDWINECAIEQIKQRLKHTEKSMKEIADEFKFPNQSFFGKYVKARLGVSPARYRSNPT